MTVIYIKIILFILGEAGQEIELPVVVLALPDTLLIEGVIVIDHLHRTDLLKHRMQSEQLHESRVKIYFYFLC